MKMGRVLAMALLVGAVCVVGCDSRGGGGDRGGEQNSIGLSRDGMDFDKDGESDSCFVKDSPDAKRIIVQLSARGGRTVEVASVDTEVALIIVCDYDGDGNLDIVYSLGSEGPSLFFIPKLVRGKSLREQVQGEERARMPVDSFASIRSGFVVKGDGAGAFAAPAAL